MTELHVPPLQPDQERLLVVTGDGSLSWQDLDTGELYHNRAGAYSEALLNYVRPSGALRRLQSQAELLVLDVCFGMGYNSFVLLEEAFENNANGRIKIWAIDSDLSILSVLPDLLKQERFHALRQCLDPAAFKKQHCLSIERGGLQIELFLDINTIKASLPKLSLAVDYVYHDPFSPRHMPELWTLEIFRHYFAMLQKRKGAVLTYSSAGAVRGGLSEAGFLVKKTAALGGKSGGTIGLIEDSSEFECSLLNEEERQRMSGSSGIPYTNAGFSLDRQEILRHRQLEQERRGHKD